jgi:hypothetical protein
MRRSAALRYAGSWAVANAVLFAVSLLFFREGHIGDASIIFIGYLYVIQALFGASAGPHSLLRLSSSELKGTLQAECRLNHLRSTFFGSDAPWSASFGYGY